MELTGKVVLITGAASGIGRAIAHACADAGARVALFDLSADVASTAEAIRGRAGRCAHFVGSVADADAVNRGVAELAAAVGPIDCVVNSAGIVDNIAPLSKMAMAAWDREIAVNLTGPFNVIRATIDNMANRGWGRIVNISSAAARSGLHNQVGYSASKSGLLGLARNVALEYARKGVTCNTVLPGMIGTAKVLGMPAAILEEAVLRTPARRVGTPEEVAALVIFLMSDTAAFINGAEIDIDGGLRLNALSLGSSRENRRDRGTGS
ncbi:MAG: hypothetical protein A2W21_11005 [Betaproteobacteria bacterium RBG_16_66_20]|nr:MAG: hypothetical protein A2W21_11005 [Betaproteobacteria bacterium RBG_16_66_20]